MTRIVIPNQSTKLAIAVSVRNAWIQALVFTIFLIIPYREVMAIETPRYIVLDKQDDFEIRQYEPRIVAEVSVDGDIDEASGNGFRLLADYIFGSNRISDEQKANTHSDENNAKIAMTAPVTVEPLVFKSNLAESNAWRVEFTMPSQYDLNTLPKPINNSISIRQIPTTFYAVITYSGMNTAQRINKETLKLLSWIEQKNIQAIGTPELARYNPPWTLPLFRRNEILVPINREAQSTAR